MMATPTTSPIDQTIGKLVDVCREGQAGYAAASKSVSDPVFRAELLQYSGQRLEFIAELNDTLRLAGEPPIAPGSATGPPASDNWAGLPRAIATGSRRALLEACEEAELASAETYRRAMGAGLPTRLMALVHTQFLAISRVRDRLQSLITAETP